MPDWMEIFAVLSILLAVVAVLSHMLRRKRPGRDDAPENSALPAEHRIDPDSAGLDERLEAARAFGGGKRLVQTREGITYGVDAGRFLSDLATRLIDAGNLRGAIEALEARLPLDREEDRAWRELDEPWDDPHVLQSSYERLAGLMRLEVLVREIERGLVYLVSDACARHDAGEDTRGELAAELAEAVALCAQLKAGQVAERLLARCAEVGLAGPSGAP